MPIIEPINYKSLQNPQYIIVIFWSKNKNTETRRILTL